MENKTTNKNVQSRRNFLKKAVYAAPAVIALGTLVEPTKANAGKPKPCTNSKLKPC